MQQVSYSVLTWILACVKMSQSALASVCRGSMEQLHVSQPGLWPVLRLNLGTLSGHVRQSSLFMKYHLIRLPLMYELVIWMQNLDCMGYRWVAPYGPSISMWAVTQTYCLSRSSCLATSLVLTTAKNHLQEYCLSVFFGPSCRDCCPFVFVFCRYLQPIF